MFVLRRRRFATLAAPLLAIALASGCATRPPADDAAPWTSGRLSLRIDAAPERPATSASLEFDLRGDAEHGELRLTSPLGLQIGQARWAPQQAVLVTPQGEQRFADLDALSREALGEVLPLAAWPSWLAGRPWPAAPHAPQADGFEQLGWRVGLAAFAEGRIDATRDAPPRVVVRIRLEPRP